MIRIRLNDEKYRYDVYQMVNLFYNFNDIQFVEDAFDYGIQMGECKLEIESNQGTEVFPLLAANMHEDVKKSIFTYFTKLTGKVLPWGTLIGIRPTKIALSLLKEGKTEDDIIAYFKEHYFTYKEKAKLCVDVAEVEKQSVNTDSKAVSVYIGMPFCPTRCLYCSFASNPIEGCKSLIAPYLKAVHYEILRIKEYIGEKELRVQSVYFGGGTPTAVSNEEFEHIVETIYEAFVKSNSIEEFTVECGRPDSITAHKLQTMKKCEVNRISINPQTMNEETLKRIGRRHSVKDVIDTYELARGMGFDNINMDIIVGLPGEHLPHIQHTCKEILKLQPDNLTVHGMSVKRASRLYENIINKDSLESLSQEELNKMYEATVKLAEELQMKPYYMYRQKNMLGNMENVGYARRGKEGLYNIQMIEEQQTIIAAGADAISKVVFLEQNRIERFGNVKDVREYVARIDELIDKKFTLLNMLY